MPDMYRTLSLEDQYRQDRVSAELLKLSTIEADAEAAFMAGHIDEAKLSGAQLVDLLKLRFRIIEVRAALKGFMDPSQAPHHDGKED